MAHIVRKTVTVRRTLTLILPAMAAALRRSRPSRRCWFAWFSGGADLYCSLGVADKNSPGLEANSHAAGVGIFSFRQGCLL